MLGAPPTEVELQNHLCFRPAAAKAVDGLPALPVLPSYDIMPSDEAVLKFINRGTSIQSPKYQIEKFHLLL